MWVLSTTRFTSSQLYNIPDHKNIAISDTIAPSATTCIPYLWESRSGEVHSIPHYVIKFLSDFTNITDRHDITLVLLKMSLNILTHPSSCIEYIIIWQIKIDYLNCNVNLLSVSTSSSYVPSWSAGVCLIDEMISRSTRHCLIMCTLTMLLFLESKLLVWVVR
jgi:hypothetical protein